MHLSPLATLAAAYRFEQLNGKNLAQSEIDEIAEHRLQDISASDLSQRLIKLILEEPPDRSSAYWALGKAYNRDLIPFFITRLSEEVSKDSNNVYQILIALDNLDEHVFSADRDGASFDECDLNQKDALNYLKRDRTRRCS